MIEAVIFDMDGLLVNSEPFWRKAEKEAFKQVGIELSDDDCRSTMGYRLNEVVRLWYSRKPWNGMSPEALEADILGRVSEYISRDADAMPGVYHALEVCKAAQVKTAIASSSPMVLIEAVVKKLGLQDAFDALHSAQHEAYGKPHPAVFLSTAATIEIEPDNCLVLEDSWHGVIAALAAKMKVVAIPAAEDLPLKPWNVAHHVLHSLQGFHSDILHQE